MKFLVKKLGLSPIDYKGLACFFPCDQFSDAVGMFSELSKISNPNVLQTASKIDEFGDQIDDYQNIQFTQKAAGDIIHPTE